MRAQVVSADRLRRHTVDGRPGGPNIVLSVECGDARAAAGIGVYEPLVVLEEERPRHTSVAAEPKLSADQWEHYHRDCHDALFGQQHDA